MHPRALRELADVVAKALTLSEKSQLAGEASDDWEKGNIAPIFKRGRKEDSGNLWAVNLISVPRNIMEKILLELY